jgi:hypothetical protein
MLKLLFLLALAFAEPICNVYGTHQWNGSTFNPDDGDTYVSSLLTIHPNNTVVSEVSGFGPDGKPKLELDDGVYENSLISYRKHKPDIPRPTNMIWSVDCMSFNSAENPFEKFNRITPLSSNTP